MPAPAVSTMATPPLLEVTGLRKLYPMPAAKGWRRGPASTLHAVDGVGLTIGQGETVGLVGESGCGKSTLVRLLARLIDPSAGTIRFAGTDIGAVPGRHRQPQSALHRLSCDRRPATPLAPLGRRGIARSRRGSRAADRAAAGTA